MLRPSRLLCLALVLGALPAVAQRQNPFQPPRAKVQYAPDRQVDVLHVAVDMDVDYPNRSIKGTARSRVVPMRDGIQALVLHAGTGLEILSVTVDGQSRRSYRVGKELHIENPGLKKGVASDVAVRYRSSQLKGRSFGAGGGGWHWIEPVNGDDNRVGFWTQGETNFNSEWAPLWDYPNDFATTETRTTVPADWEVVGNGSLVGKTVKDGRATFHWKMDQPHASYLLSLVGGRLDIVHDSWRGVPLMYVVPKGSKNLVAGSFGDTPAMLSYFSDVTGVKYPWPKYAQNAMHDFGGGMENVSSTTLGANSLTDPREGFFNMASLNSHELAHQWFGDLVSCRDWGQIWLNESFATFFEGLYMGHSRGKAAYEQEVESNMQGYFQEARRYKRPIETNVYAGYDDVFDSHAYPKGGAVLHTLRRYVGDEAFFTGIRNYLNAWRHTPVVTAQLEWALTQSSGLNITRFMDQWVRKPGHPVIEYGWTYDASARQVVLSVKQTQDTSSGTPVYEIVSKVGLIRNDKVERPTVSLSEKEQTFRLYSPTKPDAVILDPDHDFLREINRPWSIEECEPIARFAPNAIDREAAFSRLVSERADVAAGMVDVLRADDRVAPVFRNLRALANLARPELEGFWYEELRHANSGRRANAVNALAKLKKLDALPALVNDKEYTSVVRAALDALVEANAPSAGASLRKALDIESLRDTVRATAYRHLAGRPDGIALVRSDARTGRGARRIAALAAMRSDMDAETRAILKAALADPDWTVVVAAAQVAQSKGAGELKADVEAALKRNPPYGPEFFLKRVIGRLD
ncbi:MAG: M1 family metallopeptidase [Fimbriimonadaceae bacterium]|nr:M1 family metallopeptidase [Fimbriimonadaceae bacterium]